MTSDVVLPVPDCRTLTNPPARRELRADFPEIVSFCNSKRLLATLRRELGKHGKTLEEAGRITLAYPHKHPDLFPSYRNSATKTARELQAALAAEVPSVDWIIADGICETTHLARSENQSSLHALLNPPAYAVHTPSQQDSPLPFLDPANTRKEFFVVVDRVVEQGTTMANLIGYIEHNGGAVLAGTSAGMNDVGWVSLAQTPPRHKKGGLSLSEKFNDASRNTARLPELAEAFSKSAAGRKLDWSPAQCLDMFEEQMNRHGNSVFALTNGECSRLIGTVSGRSPKAASFPDILKDMRAAQPGKPYVPPSLPSKIWRQLFG